MDLLIYYFYLVIWLFTSPEGLSILFKIYMIGMVLTIIYVRYQEKTRQIEEEIDVLARAFPHAAYLLYKNT